MAQTETLARIAIDPHPMVDDVLTAPAQAFLVALHEAFSADRERVLAGHATARDVAASGAFAGWDVETAHIRSNEWHLGFCMNMFAIILSIMPIDSIIVEI